MNVDAETSLNSSRRLSDQQHGYRAFSPDIFSVEVRGQSAFTAEVNPSVGRGHNLRGILRQQVEPACERKIKLPISGPSLR